MKAFALTDVGKNRVTNQDYVYCKADAVGNLPNVFIVADGMGGHKAGDVASVSAVDAVSAVYTKPEPPPPPFDHPAVAPEPPPYQPPPPPPP